MTFNYALEVIGWVGILVVIGLVTARSIVDVALSMGFLPDYAVEYFVKKREPEVRQVLENIGLLRLRPKLEAFVENLNPSPADLIGIDGAFNDIDSYLRQSVETDHKFRIGETEDVESGYFVNLRKLVLSDRLPAIAVAFASFISDTCKSKNIVYDVITTPSSSALALSYYVSRLLEKPLVVVDKGTKTQVDGKKWQMAGGVLAQSLSGKRAILVDESAVGCGTLNLTYKALQSEHAQCEHAFLIFRRLEGRVDRYPDFAKGVTLHVMRELDTEKVKAMIIGRA